jgi:hypothetical protein
MAAWLVPALKAVLPHLGTIVSVAVPVFTKRGTASSDQAQLLQQQIAELQVAATQNAANIKALAQEMQTAVGALHQAAAIAEARLRRAYALCVAAVGVSAATFLLALYLIVAR